MEHTVHLSHKMQVMHTCVGQYPYSIRIILDTGMIISTASGALVVGGVRDIYILEV